MNCGCSSYTHDLPLIKRRVGTDLFLTYILKENGAEVDLSSREDVRVFVIKAGAHDNRERQENFTISGSALHLQINAKANTKKGVFGIRIEYKVANALSETGYMVVVHDIPNAFEIVGSSTQESLPENLKTESDVIRFGTDGLDAFETWKKYTDRADATFEDYMAAIKGERGEKGEQGERGAAGERGEKGEKGEQGAAGDGGSFSELENDFKIWKARTAHSGKKEFYDAGHYIRDRAGDRLLNLWRRSRYSQSKNDELMSFATWVMAQNAPELARIHFADNNIEQWALENFDKEGKGYMTVADAGDVEQADFQTAIESLQGWGMNFLEFEYFTKVQEIQEYGNSIFPNMQKFYKVAFPKSLKKVHINRYGEEEKRWGNPLCMPTDVLILQAPVSFYGYPSSDSGRTKEENVIINPTTGEYERISFYYNQPDPYITINDNFLSKYANPEGF